MSASWKTCNLVVRRSKVNALKCLAQREPEPLPEQLAAFGIGEKPKVGLAHLWSSHPPLEARIEALEKRSALCDDK